MEKILLDTSFVVALLDKKDVFHKKAEEIARRIENSNFHISDCVINEVLTVICRRTRQEERETVIDRINQSLLSLPCLYAYHLLPAFHNRVVETMKKTKGGLSYHDCLLIALMEKEGMRKLVSFDKYFDLIESVERIF